MAKTSQFGKAKFGQAVFGAGTAGSSSTALTASVSDSFSILDSISTSSAGFGTIRVEISNSGNNKVWINSNLVYFASDSSTLALSDGLGVLYNYLLDKNDSLSLSDAIVAANNNIALAFSDSLLLIDSISNSYIQQLFLSILDTLRLTDSNEFNPVILSNPREIRNNANNELIGTCSVVFKDYSVGNEIVPGTCIVAFKDYSAGSETTPGTCTIDFYNVIP